MTPIKVNITYTPEDLQKSYMLHFNKKLPLRSRRTLFISIILILLGVFLYYVDVFNGEMNWLCWFFMGYGVALIFYYFIRLYTMGKRFFKKLPEFSNNFTYVFSEEGISVTGVKLSSNLKWNHFRSALITNELVLLYPNEIRFNIFPKKYFIDNQYEQFVQLVKKNIPDWK